MQFQISGLSYNLSYVLVIQMWTINLTNRRERESCNCGCDDWFSLGQTHGGWLVKQVLPAGSVETCHVAPTEPIHHAPICRLHNIPYSISHLWL